MKIEDSNWKLSKGCGYYTEHGDKQNELTYFKRGYFRSTQGIVDVYADKYEGRNFINLSFVFNGREYSRLIRNSRSISDKALSTRANQFVKSIVK